MEVTLKQKAASTEAAKEPVVPDILVALIAGVAVKMTSATGEAMPEVSQIASSKKLPLE